MHTSKKVEVSYWDYLKQGKNLSFKRAATTRHWWRQIEQGLPEKTFIPLDLEVYAKQMRTLY